MAHVRRHHPRSAPTPFYASAIPATARGVVGSVARGAGRVLRNLALLGGSTIYPGASYQHMSPPPWSGMYDGPIRNPVNTGSLAIWRAFQGAGAAARTVARRLTATRKPASGPWWGPGSRSRWGSRGGRPPQAAGFAPQVGLVVCEPFPGASPFEGEVVRQVHAQAPRDAHGNIRTTPSALTDAAYSQLYPRGPMPIPRNWESDPSCRQWADAWLRLRQALYNLGGLRTPGRRPPKL